MIIPLNFGLLFAPKERGLLEEAHTQVTSSLHHLKSRTSPDWVTGMTLYEIYPRSYSDLGTLNKLKEDLPRLRDLGVKMLWLMPIHPIGQRGRKGKKGCPYAIRDYFSVHPDLGTTDHLRQLVSAVHKLDMKIILDLVANHGANDHMAMQEHPEWFRRDRLGNFTRRVSDWSDVTDLNWDDRNLRAYIKKAASYWVKEFDIDGFRCDVAGLVPLEFWADLRTHLQHLKPDIFMLAEGDHPQMHLQAFDATYDWDLYYTLADIRKGWAPANQALKVILKAQALYPQNALRLRFIENHDQPRAAQLFGTDAFKPYAALIFTIPGIPLIYNGQEVGARNPLSLFEKESINWAEGIQEVQTFYRDLIQLRKRHPQFSKGAMTRIDSNCAQEVVAFAISHRRRLGLVVLNFASRKILVTLRFTSELRAKFSNEKFMSHGRKEQILLQSAERQMPLQPFEVCIFHN